MHILSVVRLRIKPVTTPHAWINTFTLNDNSSFTRLQKNSSSSPLKDHTQMAHVHRSKDMHYWHQLDLPIPISVFSWWYFQIPLYIKWGAINTTSFQLTTRLHYGHHKLLTICKRICHMECHSNCIIISDSKPWTSCSQQCHRLSLQLLLLLLFCTAILEPTQRNPIWLLCDHTI